MFDSLSFLRRRYFLLLSIVRQKYHDQNTSLKQRDDIWNTLAYDS